MSSVLQIPEVIGLDAPANIIRIPDQIDVPVTARVMKLIDSPEFQRLTRVSQLGLVSMVYPAANHNRFEHSLGVYRVALMVLKHLGHHEKFASIVDADNATALILASLLHDIGHWPFCHPIEDLGLKGIPEHESFAKKYILRGKLAKIIKDDFEIDPAIVIDLIERKKSSPLSSLLCSVLSGPIDVDKLDYLYRDSLHAGVPYGKNFDSSRLIGSLCLNEANDRLAITHKGKTAAELMVFARYVMFSEVYWHHAVRGATAMLQRSFFWLYTNEKANDTEALFAMDDRQMIDELRSRAAGTPVEDLLASLFGDTRRLYKRLSSFSCLENEPLYRALAQQPYERMVELSSQLGERIAIQTNQEIIQHDILIDAPPVGLEVQFNVDVFYPKKNEYRRLGDVSPVVSTLAKQQFDDFVKQVRVFIHPRLRDQAMGLEIEKMLQELV